jgi:hypothetical protein
MHAPTRPAYQSKVEAHVNKTLAAKPQLVRISTAYGQQKEDSTTLPRNKYTEIHAAMPSSKEEAKRPEFKTCKFFSEAIVTEGREKGELRKVCTNPACPVHHPAKQASRDDGNWKAKQEQRRREEAIANTTGIPVLSCHRGSHSRTSVETRPAIPSQPNHSSVGRTAAADLSAATRHPKRSRDGRDRRALCRICSLCR